MRQKPVQGYRDCITYRRLPNLTADFTYKYTNTDEEVVGGLPPPDAVICSTRLLWWAARRCGRGVFLLMLTQDAMRENAL